MLSAATLTYEIILTRIFSVAQFYHFAFLIVSLALLGFGASGTALSIFPSLGRRDVHSTVSWLSLANAGSTLVSFLIINWFPFDSFTIAWDVRQLGLLIINFISLSMPFLFSGMTVGLLLSKYPHDAGKTYAINLAGSAQGCLLALALPSILQGEGVVLLCVWVAALAGVTVRGVNIRRERIMSWFFYALSSFLLVWGIVELGLRTLGEPGSDLLSLRISPYKSLSYALQYPDAKVVYQRWNAFSRVDVVSSRGVRSLPGLSYLYTQPPPPQSGVLVDGDNMSPIVLPNAGRSFSAFMPSAIAYQMRPEAEVLVLNPYGGLDVVVALAQGARKVTAVEINPLIIEAVGQVYKDQRVEVVIDTARSYLRRREQRFDVIVLSLTTSYHPIRSGAYTLTEDYGCTTEAFSDMLVHLSDRGIFVITRWLQTPPSEYLRAFILAVTSVERMGGDPFRQIIAFRSYNTGTLLVSNRPYTTEDVRLVRDFAISRAFDLVYAPGIRDTEVNIFNVLPEPIYYQLFSEVLENKGIDREEWYANYEFNVEPPIDNQPFFGQFFKWKQIPSIIAELGKAWQPFGGAGYIVLLALLILAMVFSTILIIVPLLLLRVRKYSIGEVSGDGRGEFALLFYFGLIGLGYLLLEIPLMQYVILFLGSPAYAFTTVLFALLLFSGIGSQIAHRFSHRYIPGVLVVVVVGTTWLLNKLLPISLGLSMWLRVTEIVIILAPLGFLMGMPFPLGIRLLEKRAQHIIPLAWGINGVCSVVSSITAALLALSFGFGWVLGVGALCYAGSWFTVAKSPDSL